MKKKKKITGLESQNKSGYKCTLPLQPTQESTATSTLCAMVYICGDINVSQRTAGKQAVMH